MKQVLKVCVYTLDVFLSDFLHTSAAVWPQLTVAA